MPSLPQRWGPVLALALVLTLLWSALWWWHTHAHGLTAAAPKQPAHGLWETPVDLVCTQHGWTAEQPPLWVDGTLTRTGHRVLVVHAQRPHENGVYEVHRPGWIWRRSAELSHPEQRRWGTWQLVWSGLRWRRTTWTAQWLPNEPLWNGWSAARYTTVLHQLTGPVPDHAAKLQHQWTTHGWQPDGQWEPPPPQYQTADTRPHRTPRRLASVLRRDEHRPPRAGLYSVLVLDSRDVPIRWGRLTWAASDQSHVWIDTELRSVTEGTGPQCWRVVWFPYHFREDADAAQRLHDQHRTVLHSLRTALQATSPPQNKTAKRLLRAPDSRRRHHHHHHAALICA